jgi:hypothetical protein
MKNPDFSCFTILSTAYAGQIPDAANAADILSPNEKLQVWDRSSISQPIR